MTAPDAPPLDRLRALVAALRHPVTGCAWDLAQTHASLARYAIEEAHEVAEAAERGAPGELADELGDLLLQVVLHARLAEEAGAFDLDDVARGLAAKLVRRHPHVFGEVGTSSEKSPRVSEDLVQGSRPDAEEVRARWEAAKATERPAPASVLDGVPLALPALARALKLQERAARVGFDWAEPAPVLAKVREELAEVEGAMTTRDLAAVHEEVGDLLFAAANLARHLGADPEAALRAANAKFARRFAFVEHALAAEGRPLPGASLEAMEALWRRAKAEEVVPPSPA